MKLYDLREAYIRLSDTSIPEEELADTLDSLDGELEDKVEQLSRMVRNLKSDVDTCAWEIQRLEMLRIAKQKRAQWALDTIGELLDLSGRNKIYLPTFTVWRQNNPPSVEVDMDTLPSEYVVERVEHRADKTLLADLLKSGQEIPGARLVQTKGTRIK